MPQCDPYQIFENVPYFPISRVWSKPRSSNYRHCLRYISFVLMTFQSQNRGLQQGGVWRHFMTFEHELVAIGAPWWCEHIRPILREKVSNVAVECIFCVFVSVREEVLCAIWWSFWGSTCTDSVSLTGCSAGLGCLRFMRCIEADYRIFSMLVHM